MILCVKYLIDILRILNCSAHHPAIFLGEDLPEKTVDFVSNELLVPLLTMDFQRITLSAKDFVMGFVQLRASIDASNVAGGNGNDIFCSSASYLNVSWFMYFVQFWFLYPVQFCGLWIRELSVYTLTSNTLVV